MLKGNLSSFSLGEIFQSLAVNNHTGTLKITTKDGHQKCLYFARGEITLFSSGSPTTLRIGEILIRQKNLTIDSLKSALEEQKTTGELLGKILLRKGTITKEDLRLALETKIREEIYDLFLISDAEFEFYIDHFPEEAFDPILKNTRIAINTSSVVLEGIRRMDEWRLIQRRIKTFDEIFTIAAPLSSAPEDPMVAELLGELDGKTSVKELFEIYGGSRFECAKILYEFLESGQIRPITIDEAILGGGRALEAHDVERALILYRFADQLDQKLIEVLRPLAVCLERLERPKDALKVECRALHIYSECGMYRQVLELGRKLVSPGMEVDADIPEIVFGAALELRDKEASCSMGNLTVKLALERQDFTTAEQAIEKLWALGMKDLNPRLALADQLAKAGEIERAVSHLETVARELSSPKKIKELIKVLRIIFEIDPKRQDVKLKIQNLLVKQERLEKLKKQRVTIAGGAAILLLLVSILPLIYEIKARELYCHAQRLEEISLSSNDFSKAKDAYEKLLRYYFFSTRSTPAKVSLERMAGLERVLREAQERERAAVEKAQERKLQLLREEYPSLLVEAKRLEEVGKVQEAYEICSRIATEFADIPDSQDVLFPILVTSSPRGAQVEANGAVLGSTPLLIHAQKGRELNLMLSRTGCQPDQKKLMGGQKWRVHFDLNRRPIGEMKFAGAIQQPLVAWGDRIFVPSRDGFLNCASIGRNEMVWQRRVGQLGDLVSEIGVGADGILLGNVSGEVFSILRENGKARWRAKLRAAVLAPPVLSPDGRWVAAASVDGEVAILDSSQGSQKGAFRAEDEVCGAPLFAGDLLLVGSADRRLYELDVPGATLRRAIELPAGVSTSLVPYRGSAVFGISSGSLLRYDLREGRLVWMRAIGSEPAGPPAVEGDRIYAGTASGTIVAVDAIMGSILWSLEISKARVGRLLVAGSHLFAGTESGDLVSVALATGAKEWTFKVDSAIFAPPLALESRLYVACASGKVLVMEILE